MIPITRRARLRAALRAVLAGAQGGYACRRTRTAEGSRHHGGAERADDRPTRSAPSVASAAVLHPVGDLDNLLLREIHRGLQRERRPIGGLSFEDPSIAVLATDRGGASDTSTLLTSVAPYPARSGDRSSSSTTVMLSSPSPVNCTIRSSLQAVGVQPSGATVRTRSTCWGRSVSDSAKASTRLGSAKTPRPLTPTTSPSGSAQATTTAPSAALKRTASRPTVDVLRAVRDRPVLKRLGEDHADPVGACAAVLGHPGSCRLVEHRVAWPEGMPEGVSGNESGSTGPRAIAPDPPTPSSEGARTRPGDRGGAALESERHATQASRAEGHMSRHVRGGARSRLQGAESAV